MAIHETREHRAERLRKEVIKHDSYVIVANHEGITRERVRQLAGNGLTTQSRGAQTGRCIDCRRKYKALMRGDHDGRCERCREFLAKYGHPWSRRAAQQVRQQTHCKNGHELTPENTYLSRSRKTGAITRSCRTCKRRYLNTWARSPEGRAVIKQRNERYYQELKADPEKWQRYMATRRKWMQKRKKANQTPIGKDK